MSELKNVIGGELESCCKFPMTGFFRDGYCRTCEEDVGRHTVCIRVTDQFLAFSKMAGNDLSTPMPELDFQGLIAGDQWCLCAERWQQAFEAGAAPNVVLSATDLSTLEIIDLKSLQQYAVDETQQEWSH